MRIKLENRLGLIRWPQKELAKLKEIDIRGAPFGADCIRVIPRIEEDVITYDFQYGVTRKGKFYPIGETKYYF